MYKLLLVALIISIVSCKESTLPVTQNEATAENAFLPKVMNQFPRVRDLAISPDGKEIYFSTESYRQDFAAIMVIKKADGNEAKPQVVSFSGKYRDIEPHFSQDGKKLFFASNRPKNASDTAPADYDIYVVERNGSGWGEPKNLGLPINTEKNEFYPSVTTYGDLYFTAQYDQCLGREDIYVARWDGTSSYDAIECLGPGINSPYYEFNAFVDPNDEYIIFTAYGRPDDMGGGDLYISYRDKNGNWGGSVNMGPEINTPGLDFCPFVDNEGKYLYYTSDYSEVRKFYTEALDYSKLKEELFQYKNGLGKIYKVPFPRK